MELGLSGEWAFNDKWGAEVSLPVRSVWASVSYQTPDGADYVPLDAEVHHRDETVAGLADGRLMARYSRSVAGVWVAARVGTTVPLGATEEDPFSAGDLGKRHQHIQLGSGAFEPVVSLDATWGGISQQTTAYATLQQPLYANDKGYEAGRRLLAGAQVGWKAAPDLLLSLIGEVGHEGGERWNGMVRSDGMTGMTEARVGGALLWRSAAVTLQAAVRVPVYRWLRPPQRSRARSSRRPAWRWEQRCRCRGRLLRTPVLSRRSGTKRLATRRKYRLKMTQMFAKEAMFLSREDYTRESKRDWKANICSRTLKPARRRSN